VLGAAVLPDGVVLPGAAVVLDAHKYS